MPKNRRRARLLAVVLALVVVPAIAGPVQAKQHEPVIVDIITCMYTGGEVAVEAGSPLVLNAGWAALDIPHIIWFRLSARTMLSIDGHRVPHPDRYWERPQKSYPFPDLPWAQYWNYPYHALRSGHSVTVAYDWYLRFPVSDGVDTYPRGPVNAQLGASPTCIVTAS